jgi:HEAT repeat protein
MAPADESFGLLEGLLAGDRPSWVAERAVVAISLHADPRAADVLDRVVRDERAGRQLRKHAATMLGTLPGDAAVARLRSLYETVTDRGVRENLITAVGIHGNDKEQAEDAAAVDLLIHVVDNERDRELRRHAIFWLGQMAGRRSLGALEATVNGPEDDIQTHAVFAISQRDKDEAVPILMNVARTHPRMEVRKKAIFWLGQIDDERVVAFLKEMLAR